MRPLRLPRWPILILLAALCAGPVAGLLAGPARAAPLPVPMAADAAPASAVQQARWHHRRHWHHHHHWRRHWHRHHHWRRHWHRHHHWRRHWHRRIHFY